MTTNTTATAEPQALPAGGLTFHATVTGLDTWHHREGLGKTSIRHTLEAGRSEDDSIPELEVKVFLAEALPFKGAVDVIIRPAARIESES